MELTRKQKVSVIFGVCSLSLLSRTVAEVLLWALTNFWSFYGAYVQLWLQHNHTGLILLFSLCGSVAILYVATMAFASLDTTGPDPTDPEKFKPVEQPSQEKPICPLKTHADRFVGLVQMERVMLLLYGAGVLTFGKYEMIMSKPSLEQQIVCMLDTVQRGGRDGIRKLIACIEKEDEHLGHQELAADLKREYKDLFKDNSADPKQEEAAPPLDILPPVHLGTLMETKLNFHSQKGCQENKTCEQYGLTIVPNRSEDGVLHMATCLVGNFEFPRDHELVSAIYSFWPASKSLDHTMTFDVQHCVHIPIGSVKQSTCLKFAVADTSQGRPFKFHLLEGGIFKPGCTRGVVTTKPSGLLAVVKKKLCWTIRTEPQIIFRAHLYYTMESEFDFTAHFVVTPSTKAWSQALQQHFKNALPWTGKEIDVFIKDAITVVFPDAGVVHNGWRINCTTSKVIRREDVLGFSSDRLSFGECRFSIKWVGEEGEREEGGGGERRASDLDLLYKVQFTNSHQKKPGSFHLHIRTRNLTTESSAIKGLFRWPVERDNQPIIIKL